MTHEQALFVRDLRVTRGLTWRGVAEECAEAWDGDWDGDQRTGKEICERAAAVLVEDGRRDPWN